MFRNSWIGVKHGDINEKKDEEEKEDEETVEENEDEGEGEVGVGSRENDDGCKSPAGLPTL